MRTGKHLRFEFAEIHGFRTFILKDSARRARIRDPVLFEIPLEVRLRGKEE